MNLFSSSGTLVRIGMSFGRSDFWDHLGGQTLVTLVIVSHRAFRYCSCKQDTKERYWGQQCCQIEKNISVRPTDRNNQTGQSWPPSKLVPNIPVGPNRNGPFHLMYQPKFPEFWAEWKAPGVFQLTSSKKFRIQCCKRAWSPSTCKINRQNT